MYENSYNQKPPESMDCTNLVPFDDVGEYDKFSNGLKTKVEKEIKEAYGEIDRAMEELKTKVIKDCKLIESNLSNINNNSTLEF
ncbi:hypothetical protein [Endozoicomonas sp. SCSIO W0465]|uniref:hypothetical protein n=1 Tax=Endozoicomonas sp. SCSIO W0465 TaxID=2918516 RepID=UPI002075ABD6|nr:hypothetical protein [Endozoicomonas sp. SCSIO W0465]USE36561.1 hypothetical protein MJO57_31895 [Endozoicomonas sp. SCSIO W0465]